MHVLIRSLHGFSECLSSSAHESCADSLTCHHRAGAFAEDQTGCKASLHWFLFFFSSSTAEIYWNVLIYIVGRREGNFL